MSQAHVKSVTKTLSHRIIYHTDGSARRAPSLQISLFAGCILGNENIKHRLFKRDTVDLLKQSEDLDFCGRHVSIITQTDGCRNQNRNTRTTEQNDWKSQKDKDLVIKYNTRRYD